MLERNESNVRCALTVIAASLYLPPSFQLACMWLNSSLGEQLVGKFSFRVYEAPSIFSIEHHDKLHLNWILILIRSCLSAARLPSRRNAPGGRGDDYSY